MLRSSSKANELRQDGAEVDAIALRLPSADSALYCRVPSGTDVWFPRCSRVPSHTKINKEDFDFWMKVPEMMVSKSATVADDDRSPA